MISALGRFVDALRREGVSVSPAEVLDAARAIDALGLEDRGRFRAGLRATLAKGLREGAVFDRIFERFFAPPRRVSDRRGPSAGGAGIGGPRRAGTEGRPSPVARPERERRPGSEPKGGSPARPARRGEEGPERVRRALEGARARGERREGRLRRARIDRPSRGATRGTLREELARPMGIEDERRLAREVPRLIEELRLRSGRRLGRSRRGRLWTRQIFRENLSHGGVPFVLPFRAPRPKRPRVVLLVDVSFSVARAAGYFLWIAMEFLARYRQARVLLFVDRPVDATRAVRRFAGRPRARGDAGQPGRAAPSASPTARVRRRRPGEGIRPAGTSFADLLDSLPGINLDAPSDYGRAFHALMSSRLRPASRDTVLLILGDARTNRFEPLPWALEEISRRCAALIWLVPEPRARWGSGDSALADYLPLVDTVVEANDLAGLSRGVSSLLRRL